MIKEIQYAGYATEPSDYECPDGQLTTSLNLVNEDGQLKPVFQPHTKIQLPNNCIVVYNHVTNTYKHYIIQNTSTDNYYWIDSSVNEVLSLTNALDSFEEVYKINGIGNILVFLTPNGPHYFMWNEELDPADYINLGTHIPELSISFGLRGEVACSPEYGKGKKKANFNCYAYYIKEANPDGGHALHNTEDDFVNEEPVHELLEKKQTSQVMARVNKFIADESVNKGKFLFPFLVRYAYRLYDNDTLTMHSSPVLMLTSTDAVQALIPYHDERSKDFYYELIIEGIVHDLMYKVVNEAELNELKRWKDVVKSVDVFVSKPIYTYDQEGKVEILGTKDMPEAYGYYSKGEGEPFTLHHFKNVYKDGATYLKESIKAKVENNPDAITRMGMKLGITNPTFLKVSEKINSMSDDAFRSFINGNPFFSIYDYNYDNDGNITGKSKKADKNYDEYFVKLPKKGDAEVLNSISDCADFYLLKSIQIEDLQTELTKIDIKKDYLQSLVNREALKDDYDSHDTLIPHYMYNYNRRVNFADLQKKLFSGFNPYCAFNRVTSGSDEDKFGQAPTTDTDYTMKGYVLVKQDFKKWAVKLPEVIVPPGMPIFYFYYPNPNAYSLLLCKPDGNLSNKKVWYQVPLKTHDFLSGSFYSGWVGDTVKKIRGNHDPFEEDSTPSLVGSQGDVDNQNPGLSGGETDIDGGGEWIDPRDLPDEDPDPHNPLDIPTPFVTNGKAGGIYHQAGFSVQLGYAAGKHPFNTYTIYYTLDGSDPRDETNEHRKNYADYPIITISTDTILKAVCAEPEGGIGGYGYVMSEEYFFKCGDVNFNPSSDNGKPVYVDETTLRQFVTLSVPDGPNGVTIYYKFETVADLDDPTATPTTNDSTDQPEGTPEGYTVYSEPFIITEGRTSIQVIARKTGYADSKGMITYFIGVEIPDGWHDENEDPTDLPMPYVDVDVSDVQPGEDCIINLPNKIYTSVVNNPFVFPVTMINTVGTGRIIGLASATKALSEGQFGQFPLYAFTTDGVWSLEVSKEGTYSAKNPTTRDVCTNKDSITQTDENVLFATDRGIMLLSGSQALCITDTIFAEKPFNVLELPHIEQVHAKLGHDADSCIPTKPLLGFLEGCQMVFDYIHQRITIFNPKTETVNGTTKPLYTYAYVYSLKSKQWGMMYSTLLATVNSYPDALAMTNDYRLVSFDQTDETVCKGLFITRPLKFDAPDIHKTISSLIQRGHFQRGDVGTVLYGSRDLYSWHLVWSSKDHFLRGFRGTPYKYFRIAGLTALTDGKSIFGASVNFETRHTNQIR